MYRCGFRPPPQIYGRTVVYENVFFETISDTQFFMVVLT